MPIPRTPMSARGRYTRPGGDRQRLDDFPGRDRCVRPAGHGAVRLGRSVVIILDIIMNGLSQNISDIYAHSRFLQYCPNNSVISRYSGMRSLPVFFNYSDPILAISPNLYSYPDITHRTFSNIQFHCLIGQLVVLRTIIFACILYF